MGTPLVVTDHQTHGGSSGWLDGLGRTVRTVERNRSEDDPALETFATELVYNPLGAVVEMTRGRVSGDQRSSSFSGGEFVVKTQIYDTFGRRVTNDDPDAGIYRYAYDAVDRLIATHDARAVTNRYWYDRGGRLVAEDLGGEVAYQPGSWGDAGGADGETCTTHPGRLGNCFDVLYGFDQPYLRSDHDWDDPMLASQGPLAGRPSWTRDRAGTVVLGYDPHGWAVWSGRQIAPDVTNGYFSQSTFDEGQRLLTETNPDNTSWFQYHYTTRGLLEWVWFYDSDDSDDTDDTERPLVRQTRYDVQGRKVRVLYGDQLCTTPDGSTCDPSVGGDCTCRDEGTEETYTYDSRQRLARKRAVRADDLVLLDYRYTYDSASNIVRIDDGRAPCWVAGATSVDPVATCPAPGPDVNRFVTYDITYSYDALYRLTKATPLYKLPEEDRVGEQRWSFDALGSIETWTDPADHFYGWSLGNIVNGLQVGSDPGLGPLPVGEDPVHPGETCRLDILGRCVRDRSGLAAPHALYAATSTAGDDELAAFYDAAGNMAALVVHRPRGCEQENDTGGPDGLGCKEGDDFALFFAWDEVGNLLAADRRSPVITEHADTPPDFGCTLDPDPLPFLGVTTGQYVWWCPAASLQSAYDFGNQRRVKVETYHDGNPQEFPDGYSLYVSANYELRNVELDYPANTYGGDGLIHARYARDGLATTWELDSEGPDGTDSGKYRLTLTNHLSSIGIVLDAAIGAPLRHFSQLPYGAEEKVVAPSGWEAKDVGRYEFTGKERDRGVGLTYFGARVALSPAARWLSPDPLGRAPTALNLYALNANAAPMYVDPVGLAVHAAMVYGQIGDKDFAANLEMAEARLAELHATYAGREGEYVHQEVIAFEDLDALQDALTLLDTEGYEHNAGGLGTLALYSHAAPAQGPIRYRPTGATVNGQPTYDILALYSPDPDTFAQEMRSTWEALNEEGTGGRLFERNYLTELHMCFGGSPIAGSFAREVLRLSERAVVGPAVISKLLGVGLDAAVGATARSSVHSVLPPASSAGESPASESSFAPTRQSLTALRRADASVHGQLVGGRSPGDVLPDVMLFPPGPDGAQQLLGATLVKTMLRYFTGLEVPLLFWGAPD